MNCGVLGCERRRQGSSNEVGLDLFCVSMRQSYRLMRGYIQEGRQTLARYGGYF